jgi:SAM-dependent methyltransferase
MEFLRRLKCPVCHDSLRYVARANGYGFLECRCDRWPVIDHIPILHRRPVGYFEHTTGEARSPGPDHRELVALIETGRHEEALAHCLISPKSMPALSRLIGWSLSHSKLVLGMQRALAMSTLRGILRRRKDLTPTDLFEFLCNPNSPLGDGAREYFIYRFGQPRHLAALALLQSLPAAAEPVLDLACGAGHFDHYLERRDTPTPVIGCDLNFFQLWIAKHWISPLSEFVCADLRDGLPFTDGAFSAAICSDAYHYIADRRALLAEVERCAPAKPVVLTRVGNLELGPNEGFESSIEEYLAPIPNALVFHEDGLLRDYLVRRAPRPASRAEAREHKWLSFMWNAAPSVASTTEWPHAVGRLVLNPIYTATEDRDQIHLRYHFPSAWFAFENGQMLTYLPRRLSTTRAQIQAAADALIRQTVLIGVPDRYNEEAKCSGRDGTVTSGVDAALTPALKR